MIRLLKIGASVFGLVGMLHIALGVQADVMLGAALPREAVENATLDSQNRFYGAAFMIYGALLWLCTTDMVRYLTVFRLLMLVFFVGGLARIVSLAVYGWPSAPVIGLSLFELGLPPLLLWWARGFRAP